MSPEALFAALLLVWLGLLVAFWRVAARIEGTDRWLAERGLDVPAPMPRGD